MWIILAAAIVPALLLLYYVYSKDFNPEPKSMVFKGFAYGAISVFVSTLISGPLLNLGLYTNDPVSLLDAVKVSFLGAAIPEETAKLLMLWLLLRHSADFDERYDGMVYAAAVGMGFACLENLMYVLSSGAAWFQVSMSRAMLAVPGHFSFAIAMGYFFSKARFDRSHKAISLVFAWLIPVLLHGTYDTLAFSSGLSEGFAALCSLALLVFCFFLFRAVRRHILRQAQANRYGIDS